MAVANRTWRFRRQAATHSAVGKCVFPVRIAYEQYWFGVSDMLPKLAVVHEVHNVR